MYLLSYMYVYMDKLNKKQSVVPFLLVTIEIKNCELVAVGGGKGVSSQTSFLLQNFRRRVLKKQTKNSQFPT